MNAENARSLWFLIAQFWDDNVTNRETNTVRLNARTVRVLRSVFGADAFDELCQHWVKDGDLRILGNPDELAAEAPCIEILDYVNDYSKVP